MKLQILIPQYHETEEVIAPLLKSIEIQQNVDIKNDVGVIICSDEEKSNNQKIEELKKILLEKNVDVKIIKKEKYGPITACFREAEAERIMFLNCPIEEWKDIKGYEGLYRISSYGRIYSYPRKKNKGGGFIKTSKSTSGYQGTHLSKNGNVKTFQIHRLVAEHFLINENNYPEVNHKDECKENNCVWNLEYCTRVYNQNYGTAIARAVKTHNYKESAIKSALHHNYKEVGRKQAKPVLQEDLNGNFIKRWDSIREAGRQLRISPGNISLACRNSSRTAGGYKWEYGEKENEKT